jgi:hypothetical protein
MILTNVIEERWVDSSVYAPSPPTTTTPAAAGTQKATQKHRIIVVKRELSQAMIPGKHLVKVHVRKSLYEQRVAPVFASELCDQTPQEHELI